MSLLPIWARKPKHEREVIATEKGWVVEDTGEVLRSDRHLLSKLDKLQSEVNEVSAVQQEPIESVTPDNDTTLEGEPTTAPEKTVDIPEPEPVKEGTTTPKKKPGRPKKSDSNKNG